MVTLHTEPGEIVDILSAAVAPVFLITGIVAIIAAMNARYNRVIDRTRTLLRDGPKLYGMALGADHMEHEFKTLYKRARMLRLMIISEIVAASMVVLTICSVFLSLSMEIPVGVLPIVFFLLGLFCMLAGLISFIGDFFMSLRVLEHDMRVRANIDVDAQ
ncbi:Protein of unknown function [Pseudobacteriovorax antillogorgiicola]|uniref:DUF2721 domain-containing protein n=2 Tax=Pseudobacteriovorax antillogorgiicola TaxID=1513793 RepID=A0A1Y6CNN8_9BACT|nr:uncharacterized protein DUF2721 [Pseudobacteriovorax antillogorgiicola]SMF77185.1 Protein of unknown function [Pseudobacteriovorax antillogorgiicola]